MTSNDTPLDVPGKSASEQEESVKALRQQAEARWTRQKSASATDRDREDSASHMNLIHELEVHQIELEIQNEELRRAQQELEISRERFVDLYDFAPVGYCTLNYSGLISQANLTLCSMLSVVRGEFLNKPFTRFIKSDDQDVFYQLRKQSLKAVDTEFQASSADSCELRMLRADGSDFWGHLTIATENNGLDEQELLVVVRDVTVRKLQDEKLRLAAAVFTSALEGIMITDIDGNIIEVNDAFTSMTGYSAEQVMGHNPRILASGRHDKEFFRSMWHSLIEQGNWSGEIWNRRSNGEVFVTLQTISAMRGESGAVKNYVSLFSDITALKKHQRQLEHIAHYDALTHLPNRSLFSDRLHQSMSQADRRGQKLAVVFLDLDGFKEINDQYGHDVGDQVLIALSLRMHVALREGDTLARLGGDEFVAILIDLPNTQDCLPLLTRLLQATAQPVQVGELTLQVSASLGVSFYPQQNEIEADQLLRQADLAMYEAKIAGKNCYRIFDTAQESYLRDHHESLESIRLALENREFVMFYQPKVNMRSGQVIGLEALIRWQHPQKGLLAPGVFLPLIEEHELSIDMGEWVIDTVLAQMESWHSMQLDVAVSVNVAPNQLQAGNFVEQLKAILSQHPQIKPACLELEVLETSDLEDITQVSQVMAKCREMGVKFALDDFGTGYSSLTYLKRLDVAILKIDQSFVRDMLDDPEDLAILEGVIGLARAFHREVIAEGVETIEHGEMLLQLGCELAQGYGIARPMPADQITAWVENWKVPDHWSNCAAVSHNDLPLLYAIVEHRVWVRSFDRYIKGKLSTPPRMEYQQCRFGFLMERLRASQPGSIERFHKIDPLHKRLHALAYELAELYRGGHGKDAMLGLDELHDLRDEMIKQLHELLGCA